MKELYDVDMNETQRSKLLDELPEIDLVVTMGCNVACPQIPCKHREDWGLEDPTGKGRQAFVDTIKVIEDKILDLKDRVEQGKI